MWPENPSVFPLFLFFEHNSWMYIRTQKQMPACEKYRSSNTGLWWTALWQVRAWENVPVLQERSKRTLDYPNTDRDASAYFFTTSHSEKTSENVYRLPCHIIKKISLGFQSVCVNRQSNVAKNRMYAVRLFFTYFWNRK